MSRSSAPFWRHPPALSTVVHWGEPPPLRLQHQSRRPRHLCRQARTVRCRCPHSDLAAGPVPGVAGRPICANSLRVFEQLRAERVPLFPPAFMLPPCHHRRQHEPPRRCQAEGRGAGAALAPREDPRPPAPPVVACAAGTALATVRPARSSQSRDCRTRRRPACPLALSAVTKMPGIPTVPGEQTRMPVLKMADVLGVYAPAPAAAYRWTARRSIDDPTCPPGPIRKQIGLLAAPVRLSEGARRRGAGNTAGRRRRAAGYGARDTPCASSVMLADRRSWRCAHVGIAIVTEPLQRYRTAPREPSRPSRSTRNSSELGIADRSVWQRQAGDSGPCRDVGKRRLYRHAGVIGGWRRCQLLRL